MKYNFDQAVDRRGTRSSKWSNSDVIPLWVADMDFPCPPAVGEAIQERAKHNLYGYDLPPEGYFDALQDWFWRRHNFHVQPDWLITTSGVVGALHLAIHSLTLPGDAVLIQPPVYHPFARSILRSGRQLVTNPLRRVDNHYDLDLEDLDAKLSNPLVKLFILCNPHNPVGKVYTKEELKAIGELALRHRVVVVADEIHGDIIMQGHKHIPFASISEEFARNCVICTAPSKTFNLAGLATSNVFVPCPTLRDQFARFSQSLGLHGGTLYGFIACEAAYRKGDAWLDELLLYIEGNTAFLREYLAQHIPILSADELQGTYLQWVNFQKLEMAEDELETFLKDRAHLWLSQGYIFGEQGRGFARVNLATQRSVLNRALEQLANAVRQL